MKNILKKALGALSLTVLLSSSSHAQDHLEYRDIFNALAKDQYSEEEIKAMLLVPTSESSSALASTNLELISSSFVGMRPSDFYRKSLETPFQTIENPLSAIAQKGPATIIVVPGIFGEFIDDVPFETVLSDTQSSFYQKFHERLGGIETSAYSIESLNNQNYPLNRLINVASIDDDVGKPIVNLIFLRPLRGSLETLGDISNNAQDYQTRLDQAFRIIPPTERKNLYIMGYSRGATVALELLHASRKANKAWSKSVKGVISLAGVLYASEVADDAIFNVNSPAHKVLKQIEQLAEGLEVSTPEDSTLDKTEKILRNNHRWIDAKSAISDLADLMETPQGLDLEFIETEDIEFSMLVNTAKSIAFDFFRLDSSLTDYFNNVRRFKIVVTEVLKGVKGLTTESRKTWWRTHSLPTDVSYYAITATMADVTRGMTLPTGLHESRFYGQNTMDYKNLRKGYYDFYGVSLVELNDSQVSLPKAQFLPEVTYSLNPQQAPIKTHLVSVFGAHHWAVAFPIAIPMEENLVNPFPRKIMLKALAGYLLK